MNREKMIEALIDNDLNDWNSKISMDEYFAFAMREGFVGYKNQTDHELKQEMIERGLIEESNDD